MKRLVIDASTLVFGITGSDRESPPCVIYDAVSERASRRPSARPCWSRFERALRKPYFRALTEDEEWSKPFRSFATLGPCSTILRPFYETDR